MSDYLQPHGLTNSTPGFPALHHLPEFAQTHIHSVTDAIQPSHSLLSLLLPSIFPSIRVFIWLGSSHQVGKGLALQSSVLTMNIQGWFPLGLTGLISLLSKGLSKVFSKEEKKKKVAGVGGSLPQHHNSKHQFSGLNLLHNPTCIHTWLPEKL